MSTEHATNIGKSVLRDLDIDGLVAAIPTYTIAGAAALRERLSNPTSSETTLQKRQIQLKEIKGRITGSIPTIHELRTTLRDTEEAVLSVANAATDARHSDFYTQILWPPESRFAWLNTFGWLNEAIIFFRTLFLPGLSVILPVFVFVAPLVFYNLVLKEPLTMSSYFQLLQTSLKKAVPAVLGKPRFAGTGGALEFGEQFIHVAISVAMFGASIWNQVSASIHMRSVVTDMRSRADAVLAFRSAVVRLAEHLGVPVVVPQLTDGQLGLFGHAWNDPEQIRGILKVAGELDMLSAVALAKRTCFPTVSADKGLRITDLYHPGLQATARIYNSVDIHDRNHVLLTGPNRGGKSTLLKSLGCAVLMAQTVGIVFGRRASLPVFQNIVTALSPQDVIGRLSLFEAEIEFAKEVRTLVQEDAGPSFLMMDEIFHGTNAHDGVEASQVFLDELYEAPLSTVISVVSTHYMELPARYKGKALTLCMEATVHPTDPEQLVYTYRVKTGVNHHSSVREILRERGLLVGRGSPREKTTASENKE